MSSWYWIEPLIGTKEHSVTPSSPSGRRAGYARVSTDDQNLSRQLDTLAQHGVAKDLIFTDKLSVGNQG